MATPFLPGLSSLGLGLNWGDSSSGRNVNQQFNIQSDGSAKWPFSDGGGWMQWVALGGVALGLYVLWRKVK